MPLITFQSRLCDSLFSKQKFIDEFFVRNWSRSRRILNLVIHQQVHEGRRKKSCSWGQLLFFFWISSFIFCALHISRLFNKVYQSPKLSDSAISQTGRMDRGSSLQSSPGRSHLAPPATTLTPFASSFELMARQMRIIPLFFRIFINIRIDIGSSRELSVIRSKRLDITRIITDLAQNLKNDFGLWGLCTTVTFN